MIDMLTVLKDYFGLPSDTYDVLKKTKIHEVQDTDIAELIRAVLRMKATTTQDAELDYMLNNNQEAIDTVVNESIPYAKDFSADGKTLNWIIDKLQKGAI